MGARQDAASRALSALPAVHELAAHLDAPHVLAVAAARRAIDERRAQMLAGGDTGEDLTRRARTLLAELERPSLRRVLNATGVIAHTNLGRAPLATAAQEAVARAMTGYSNLELDLRTGSRGSRQVHVIDSLRELSGAADALVVNNGAAAVLLAVATLAGPGRAVVVSRGQLVEIGGGFRIPEVIAQSGTRLIEVGTTNRTRLADYERALAGSEAEIAAILRVHPSNFRAVGFVEDVEIEELCRLGTPVIDDVGSGLLADAGPGANSDSDSGARHTASLGDEPSIRRSIAAGAALLCCSGDKLLGGPQAGLLLGDARAVAAARAHPLARAMRIDKLSLAALEGTLALYRDPERARREVPVLAMLYVAEDTLAERAGRLAGAIGAQASVVRAAGKVGGGALPLLELEGPAVALQAPDGAMALASALREADPPVISRINDGRVLLDPRTLADDEIELVAAAARSALEQLPRR